MQFDDACMTGYKKVATAFVCTCVIVHEVTENEYVEDFEST